MWGLIGGLSAEAMELYAVVHRTPKWSWKEPLPGTGTGAFIAAVIIRVSVGAVLASAFAGSHQVSGPLAAFTLGVAAPYVIQRLARAIPLSDDPKEIEAPPREPYTGDGEQDES